MLERFFLHAEKTHNYLVIIGISFLVSVLLSIVNYFIQGNSLFLVALIALSLSYPIVNYLRQQTKKEFTTTSTFKEFFERYENELAIFWGVFLGITLGFYAGIPLLDNLDAQENFATAVNGYITQGELGFEKILFNNLVVGFFTFLLSVISFSGLVLVLSWNASILAYYVWSFTTLKESVVVGLMVLPHGLLEIAGYVLLAIAGSLLSYKLDTNFSKRKFVLSKQVIKDITLLIILGISFILIGAFFEVL